MRALRYVAAGKVEVSEIDEIPPAEGQVQIEVAYTGVCGTDLHIFHGSMDGRVTPPAVIGHEMSGRVAAMGSAVDGWLIGDAVTVMPLDWDGICPACVAGNTHLCHNLKFIGIDAAGSLQRLWTLPARTLVRLPNSISLEHAALVEPSAVAVHDVRRARLVAGEKAVVVGAGPVGFLIAVVARDSGADVLVIEPNPYRRGLADSLGLRTLDPAAVDITAAVTEWTAGAGAAVAFEVSGAAAGVTAAVDALAVRGRLVLVAIHGTPREVNLHRFFWRELSLVGARLYDRADFERAVELVATGVIPAADLISAVVPLSEGSKAFELLEGGEVMKVLIDSQS